MRRTLEAALTRMASRLALFAIPLLGFALLFPGPTFAYDEAFDAAYRAIAIAEDQRNLEGLSGYLNHEDAAVRRRAVLAVGRLQDSTSVTALIGKLKDKSLGVRREAIFALGQVGHKSGRKALEGLLRDPDEGVLMLAVEALGKIGDKASTRKVAGFLGYPSPTLRAAAGVALWRLADSTAIDALLAHHEDPDPEVRWRVLYALERTVAPERIELIAALHLDDDDALVRAYAARTLGRQQARRGAAYLTQKFDDPDVGVMINAMRAVQRIADSTCTTCSRLLLDKFDEGHPYLRMTAATVLGEPFVLKPVTAKERQAVIDTLTLHLADSDAATRGICAASLLSILGAKGLAKVQPLLSDSSVYVRAAVLTALEKLPVERATPLLVERLASRYSLNERMSAALALGNLKSQPALERLRSGLNDDALLYVAAVATALGSYEDKASVPALVEAYANRAGDADADARIAIRDALVTLQSRAFADSIEAAHPSANAQPQEYAPDFHKPPTVKGAVIRTTAGDLEWAFYTEEAPQTVRNFVQLARTGYFNGKAVHRVVPNFVVQDGDPTGTGWGGPGYTIRCEYNQLRYGAGMVGMALSGKDTGGSQWFITHSPQPHLNGRYTIFAHVTKGMEFLNGIVQGTRILEVKILD